MTAEKETRLLLSYRLLKNHAGILLIGDYTSLQWLHEVVDNVNGRSPLIRDKDGMSLGLAGVPNCGWPGRR
jgi:hypothetical protein